MTKIVYNACYGGFGLSPDAVKRYADLKGISLTETTQYGCIHYYDEGDEYFSVSSIARADPDLVQVVEEMGEQANTPYSNLRIEELPSGTRYRIDTYDGYESVQTVDSYDWSVA